MATPCLRTRRVILSTGIAALLGSSFVATPQAPAADVVKANNTTALNTGTSWVLGSVPTTSDVALWDSTVTSANAVALGADLTFGGLKITNPGGPVTITAGNTLTLGASGINMSAATQNLTISSGLTLGAAQTWDLGTSGRTLSIGGALNLGGNALTLNGGTHLLTGIISGSGGLTIGAGNGAVALLSAANTFAGQTTVVTGSIATLSNAAALGAGGAGNETIINSGGTLNLGGQALATESLQISGTGVGGIGALINQGASTAAVNTTFVTLTGDATFNAGGNLPAAFNAAGTITTGGSGRFDTRLSAYTSGAKNLDLAGKTLTKIGAAQYGIVNADVTAGNIVVNEGTVSIEGGTVLNGAGSITVNQNGKLSFWGLANNGANVAWPVTVNGGSVGDTLASSASQTVVNPFIIAGSINPNFVAGANTTTLSGLISKATGSTVTELAKRGGATLALSNAGNSFDVPVTIYSGNLQANYSTAVVGGVAPATPVLLTGTPLGTADSVTIAGGTLNIRVDGAGDATNQVFTIGKTIYLDRAPGGINLDRLTASGGTDKNLSATIVFAPASANNGYSIGQNQLTGTQTNGFRTQIAGMTMNSDTVLNVGDFTFTGNVTSANKNSLIHTGGNSWGFASSGGTQEFNAVFNLGNAQMRVGSMYGTGVTSDTVTAGTGPIINAPNTSVTFRTPTNIATGQTIEVVSQRLTQSTVNFEQFTSVPTSLRAMGSGVIGVGNATAFGDIDLSRIGDGTFRIGSNFAGSGNGTITGVISPGAGDVVRVGAGGTMTVSGTNRITGNASLDVGSDLVDGGFRTSVNGANQTGTVLLTGANNYTGGTNVNRGSTLRFQNTSLGNGPINVFGTLTAEQAGSVFTADGLSNVNAVSLFGGSTLFLDNSAVTATSDVNRWGDTTPIALTNTALTISSRNINGAADTIEAFGAMSFAGGNVITLNRTQAVANHNVQVTVDSLTRSGQGTIELARTTGTGAGYGGGQKFIVTNNAPTPVNGMVAPWIVAQNNGPTEFMTYNATGFAVVTYDNTVTTGTYTAGALDYNGTTGGKTLVTTADLTLQDNPTLYALRSERTINTNGTNNTITLRSGGLILRNIADNTTLDIKPAVVANNGTAATELIVQTAGGGAGRNYQFSSTITANGLTKFGAGNLILTTASPNLTGPVSVNAGTLELRAAGSAGNGNITLAGGQLNVRINGAATTYVNGITVAENIPIAVLDVGNLSTASNASAITFNAAAANTPGLVLAGSPGTQGQTLTIQTNGNGTGSSVSGITFGNNMLNSFAGNVTLNITGGRTLTLNNNPTITGSNPVFTKSGDGILIVGPAFPQPSGVTVAPGTRVVVDNGTLEMRSVVAFGTADTTSITLNRGTLNLRRDSAANYGVTGGGSNGTPYPVTVNGGNPTISADRVSAGAEITLGLGKLTINNDSTVTLSNGNGVALDFAGADLKGSAFFNANTGSVSSQNSGARLQGLVAGGALVKGGTGYMQIMGTNNTYDGGTYVQQGFLRLRGSNSAGTGPVYVNPGAILDFNSNSNLAPDQPLIVRSNSAFPTMISVNADGVTHPVGANVDFSNAATGIVGLSNGANVYNSVIDLGALYGGRWSLGGIPSGNTANGAYDARYTADSLGVGTDNLYRLGGGGTSFFLSISDAAGTPRNNVLTGAANSVRLGFDSGNILPVAATNYQFVIGGTQDFGGSTVIHRGMVTRLGSAAAGGKSGLSSGQIDIFGSLYLSSNATLQDGGTATNALVLHPGATIQLDNNNAPATNMAAANVANRLADNQPLVLNGAQLDMLGNNNNASTETVGDTTFSRGARIRVSKAGTGTTTLTLNSLTADGNKGNSLLIHTSGAGTLGTTDRILVSNNAPTPVNGMVSSQIVNATDASFVTYDSTKGFSSVTYDKTLNATYAAGSLLPTDKVDVGTAALTLSDNPTVYALRTNQSINLGGPFTQMTIRSGGLIAQTNTVTISPNLVFNDGNSNVEARIYAGSAINLNGTITANGVVKSGNGALNVNVPQANYASGWVVNSGDLQFADLGAAGQSVAGNGITVNATQTTGAGGLNPSTMNASRVIFTRDMGTPELATFTGGPVTVVNEGTVRIAAGDNRNLQIPAVTALSTGTGSRVALTLDVPNNRFRGVIPTLTLQSDTLARVYDSGSTGDTGRITAAVVNSLVGTDKNLTKIGNRTLELAGNNSATFTGGSITVSQGTLRVLDNGSLGSATTKTTIERNATLEIAKSNFAPVGTVTQQPGSIERWNVEDARSGNYNLPSGVNLQLNTNLVSSTPRTIGLNGGSLEGFLWTDHPAAAVQRTVGSAVTLNLLANSSVGQNILQGQGYDAGRGPTVAQPYGDNVTGAFLRIEGKITGGFNLTKTGLDTVTIASTGNTYNNTFVDMGVLRIGANDALPTGKTLTTRLGGTFDLNGFDQTVAGLGTADGGTNPGGVSVGSSGAIVNSGVVSNTLKVNNSADFTYNGKIDRNVALTKAGIGKLTLGADNTYIGNTAVESGTLALTGSISGSPTIDVKSGANLDVSALLSGFTLGVDQILKGNGAVTGAVFVGGVVAPSAGPTPLTVSDVGVFSSGSTLSLDLSSPTSFSKLAMNGVSLNGTVNLTIGLGFTPVENSTYMVLNNSSPNAISGTTGFFTWGGPEGVLTEGERFFVNGQGFTISYKGGTGNDVVLTAIPEPGVAASLLGGLGLMLGLRRRRRA
ncbi:beta strand repeat-containing protein [Verrucomicrobiota bacterium sgz303538]